MSDLRAELRNIVDQLVQASEATGEITLDQLGAAVGVLSVSYAEIDAMVAELEARGRTVVSPVPMQGELLLQQVVAALRTLRPQLGRPPTQAEIAEHTGLTLEQVRHALALAQVMQR